MQKYFTRFEQIVLAVFPLMKFQINHNNTFLTHSIYQILFNGL